MRHKLLFFLLFTVALLALPGCTVSRQKGTPVGAIPTFEVQPVETLEPTTATPEVAATATVTPEPDPNQDPLPVSGAPLVRTSTATNVRHGPGLNYQVSHVLPAGTTAPILGRNAAGSWWVVPGAGDGSGPVGWISGAVVTVQGDAGDVPVLPAPPPPDDPDDELPLVDDPGTPPSNACAAVRPGQFPPPLIYLGPGPQFAPMARLGNWAEVLKTEVGWHQILLGPGDVGWINSADVDLSGACVAPDPAAERIQFAPGETSAEVEGMLEPPQRDFYLFRAFAGQRVSISIVSESNRGGFAVSGVSDGQPYKRLEDERQNWSIILPATQDYRLTVAAPADAPTTGYRIFLSIEPLDAGDDGLHPIADGRTHFLLGASRDGAWLTAAEMVPELGTRQYTLYDITGASRTVTGVPPVAPGGICANPKVVLNPPGDYNGSIALAAGWDAAPRPVQWLSTDIAEYREMVAALLQENGLENPEVQLSHVMRVDLEGDGVDEVLVGATRLVENTNLPPVAAEDYSTLILRKVVGDTVINVPLRLDVYPEASDLAYPYRYEVVTVLDLNGDGVMEIVVSGLRYEGEWVGVFEVTGDGAELVLEADCAQ